MPCQMQLWNILLVLLATATMAMGAPTFDVLYKMARDLENELVSDTVGHRREPYRPPPPGYRPPYGNGYYPPHSHDARPPIGVNGVYPERYPSAYPGQYQAPYPGQYADSHRPSHYPDPYSSRHPQYSQTNYIQGPAGAYDDTYPSRGSGYGQVNRSSYPGYKTNGY